MFIPNELEKLENKDNLLEISELMLQHLYDIVDGFFSDKSMFSMDNFSAHVLDEFELKTNCHKDIFRTIYLEINQPLNHKIETIKNKSRKKHEITVPNLYLTLSDIRKGLYDAFIKHFDNNNIVWLDKYSICMKSTVLMDNGNKDDFYFRIIPCLTYYNKQNIRGVMYYSNNDIELEYPNLLIDNFYKKNQQTNDLFRKTILILKNILLKEKDIDKLPTEIIETLVYNVPNKLFESDNKQCILTIINFIRNNSLSSFKTIDEQDFAFSSIYRSMSPFYCKHILKIIEKYLQYS